MDFTPKTDEQWKEELSPEAYEVLRQGGTERAFTGELLHNKDSGEYVCGACGNPLFDSSTKFDSGSGWPSFWDSTDKSRLEFKQDNRFGMSRIEVRCQNCGSHLGHLFDDATQTPTGQRYCINSAALKFNKKDNT